MPDVVTFSRVSVALSVTWSDLENQVHPPWKNRRFSVGDVTSVSRSYRHKFNGYPYIFDRDRPNYDEGDHPSLVTREQMASTKNRNGQRN